MVVQPSGTVTLVFTDIEGSTRLLSELGQDAYLAALARHRGVVREAFARYGGYEVDYEGDAFFYAFPSAAGALAAVQETIEGLAAGPLWLRVGVHTGEPGLDPPKYVGIDVHKAARVMSAGHGGQVLVSQATRDLVGDKVLLVDLGEHRLKDLTRPERIYQLGDGEFPPLESLNRTNLPLAAGPLLGRSREVEEIVRLVRSGVRLLTLTGPGGVGKTRLALQAAAELVEEFQEGVFFVPLAPLREATEVLGSVAQALQLRPDDDVRAHVESRRLLVVLDNAEHLAGIAATAAELLVGEVVVLVTSRVPLHLAAEREFPVDTLPEEAAGELFVTRAAAIGRSIAPDETVSAICRRLDNLPLAVELAAAGTKLFSPRALLERLEHALPLLSGGAVDAPERQQTLQATIEWSHDLLDETERRAFRRISVFRGAWSLDAAEAITETTLTTLASLVDKSLLKPAGDDRFLMLETVREYAHEQLEGANETREYERRHAHYYLARLEEIDPMLRGPRTREFLAWFEREEDNLRATIDHLADADPVAAARSAILLSSYWTASGRLVEGRERLRVLSGRSDLPVEVQAALLQRLADVALRLGALVEAEDAASSALRLAEEREDHLTVASALVELAWMYHLRQESSRAVELGERAVAEARLSTNTHMLARALDQLGVFLTGAGRVDDARHVIFEAIAGFRKLGDRANEAGSLGNLGSIDFQLGDYDSACTHLERAVDVFRELGHRVGLIGALSGLGYALLALRRPPDARESLGEALELAFAAGQLREAVVAAGAFALAADDPVSAARLRGATATLRQQHQVILDPGDERFEHEQESALVAELGESVFERERILGGTLSIEEVVQLARQLADLPKEA